MLKKLTRLQSRNLLMNLKPSLWSRLQRNEQRLENAVECSHMVERRRCTGQVQEKEMRICSKNTSSQSRQVHSSFHHLIPLILFKILLQLSFLPSHISPPPYPSLSLSVFHYFSSSSLPHSFPFIFLFPFILIFTFILFWLIFSFLLHFPSLRSASLPHYSQPSTFFLFLPILLCRCSFFPLLLSSFLCFLV